MSMPSWEVHEKYAKLMGIPIEVAKEINKLVDDPKWHDFFDSAFVQKFTTPHLRCFGGRIIIYYFDSERFCAPAWEHFRRRIESHGEDGFRAFFLHMYLDLIERNERGRSFAMMGIKDIRGPHTNYTGYIMEVEAFLQSRINEVLADVWEDIRRRRGCKHSRL